MEAKEIVRQLEKASKRKDANAIAHMLGQNRRRCSTHINGELIESSDSVKKLVETIVSRFKEDLDSTHLVEMVLLFPTGYDTPWFFMSEVLLVVNKQEEITTRQLRTVISTAQSLLQMVATNWWDLERRKIRGKKVTPLPPANGEVVSDYTPSSWLVHMVETTLSCLVEDSLSTIGCSTVLHDLVLSVVELVGQWNDDVSRTLLEDALQCPASVEKTGWWLCLVAKLCPHLRNDDLNKVCDALSGVLDALHEGQAPSFCQISEPLFDICFHKANSDLLIVESSDWMKHLLLTMKIAYCDYETSLTVESLLERKVDLLSRSDQTRMIAALSEVDEVGLQHIAINILLAVIRSAKERGMEMVAACLDKALGMENPQESSGVRWNEIPKVISCFCRSLESGYCRKSLLNEFLEAETEYSGRGYFKIKKNTACSLSSVGRLVYLSMFPGTNWERLKDDDGTPLRRRFACWLEIIRTRRTLFEDEETISAVVCVVLVHEIPWARGVLCDEIVSSVSRSCSMVAKKESVRLIVHLMKVLDSDKDLQGHSSVSDVLKIAFSSHLPDDVFALLAYNLVGIEFCQPLLLEYARSTLSFDHSFRQCTEVQKRSLLACCALFSCRERSNVSQDACNTVIAIISSENPCLQPNARSWFFGYLTHQLSRRTLDQCVIDQLGVAAVKRFISFLSNSANGWSLETGLSVTVIEEGDKFETIYHENMGGLFRLVIHTMPDNERIDKLLSQIFSKVLICCASNTKEEARVTLQGTTSIEISYALVVAVALKFAVNLPLNINVHSQDFVSERRILVAAPVMTTSPRLLHERLQFLDEFLLLAVESDQVQNKVAVAYQLLAIRHDLVRSVRKATEVKIESWTRILRLFLESRRGHDVASVMGLTSMAGACEVCRALSTLTSSERSLEAYTKLLGQLWSCYCSFAREFAGRNLVAAFESCLEKDGFSLSYKNGFPRNLPEVGDARSVDAVVQYVRTSVLEAVHNCVSLIKELEEGEQKEVKIGERHHSSLPLQLSALIGSACDDLWLGLSGESGGMTEEMFIALTGSVKVACLLLTNTTALDVKSLADLAPCCQKAGKRLLSLMRSEKLSSMSAYRAACKLCFSVLPRLSRRICRTQCLLHGGECLRSIRKFYQPVVGAALTSCVEVLRQNSHAVVSGESTWDEIFCDNSVSSDDSAEAVVSSSETIFLPTDKAWISAFCACLEGLEHHWADSHENQRQEIHLNVAANYLLARETEYVECLSAVAPLFDLVGGTSQLVLAVILPIPVKTRLCTFLETVVKRLASSLREIMQNVEQPCQNSGTQLQFSVVESTTWVLAWLSKSSPLNVGECMRLWYVAEKEALNSAKLARTGIFNRESSILRRLPKAAGLFDNLVANVMDFRNMVSKLSGGSLAELIRGSKEEGVGLETLLTALDNEISLHEQALAGVDNAESLKKVKHTKRKEERLAGEKARKVKRRKVLRSRHRTVDKWLHQDREVDDNEAVDDDDFSDLEDFLVDG